MKKAVVPAIIASVFIAVLASLILAVPAVADSYGRPDVYGSASYPQRYGKQGTDINKSTMPGSFSVLISADKNTLSEGKITFELTVTGGDTSVDVTGLCIIPSYDVDVFEADASETALTPDSVLNDSLSLGIEPAIKNSGWTKEMQAYTVTAVWESTNPAVIPEKSTTAFYSFALVPKTETGESVVFVYVTVLGGSGEYSRLLEINVGSEDVTLSPTISQATETPTATATPTPTQAPTPTAAPTDTPAPTATEVPTPPPETLPPAEDKPIRSIALSVGDSLALKVKTVIPEGAEYPRMRFSHSVDGGEPVITEGKKDDSGYTWFVLPDIAFTHMSCTISFELLDGDRVIDERQGFSVKKYAEDLHAKYPDDEKLTVFLGRMLIYGAAAQSMFLENTLEPATKDVDFINDGEMFGTPGKPDADAPVITEGDEPTRISGWGLSAGKFAYWINSSKIGGRTCSISGIDGYGQAPVTWYKNDPLVTVWSPKVSLLNLGKTCRFDNGSGNTIEFSGLTYIAYWWDLDEGSKPFNEALYAWYLSALDYVN